MEEKQYSMQLPKLEATRPTIVMLILCKRERMMLRKIKDVKKNIIQDSLVLA